ncbi:MAG: TonB-dependent receptor [Pseudomonadota bacterium]
MIKTAAALAALCCLPCLADDLVIQRVLVDGARASQLGVADSADSGTVSAAQLAARSAYRPGELLEATPGLVVSQHSGEGKANQFYLRGFNLDHGTDLRTTLDDVPVNQRSHAHGQGWTDLNFLIPELVGRLDYGKGPYSARAGDFASAGTASLSYVNRLVKGVAGSTLGQGGYARALLADSPEAFGGNLLYALEVLHNDGPFTRPDDYQKLSGVLRFSQGYANNGFSVTAMAYRGRWNATDQVPQRAVGAGTLGRFDAVDPSDGGAARRVSLSAVWRETNAGSASKISAYIVRNELELYSNFTYYLDDPVHGDQFAQLDRRVTAGLDASHTWHVHALDTDTVVGLQLQNDNIFNGLEKTEARRVLAVTRADHLVESSVGVYAENHTRWTPWLRTVAGLRADAYRFGSKDAQLASPSFGVAFGPWARTEAYLNAGTGFHSNDARSASLVRTRGLEAGLRTEAVPGLQTSLSLYRLDVDSELVYVGDAGTTEAGPASHRRGIELSNYYKAKPWLALELDLAYARARSADGSFIPGAVEGVAQLAATITRRGPWSGALRLRYFGPRPLVQDNSVRSRASATVNGRIAYRISPSLLLEMEAFNLANRTASAVDYFYASRRKGEAAAHDDIHFHPLEARSLRATLVKNF